jgi:Ca2+-binding EF-hand superfamily protein
MSEISELSIRILWITNRSFMIMDDDRNHKLSFDEFKKGCRDYGLTLDKDELFQTFQAFDNDKSGSIDFDEFLIKLRVSWLICFH